MMTKGGTKQTNSIRDQKVAMERMTNGGKTQAALHKMVITDKSFPRSISKTTTKRKVIKRER